jgi:hypothetical protein
MTPTPSATLFGVDTPDDMPEQDVASIDMFKAPSIQDDNNSSLNESQPFRKLFPDPEPVDKMQQEPGHGHPNLHPLQFQKSKYQRNELTKSKYNLTMNLMMNLILNHLLLLTIFLGTHRLSTAEMTSMVQSTQWSGV